MALNGCFCKKPVELLSNEALEMIHEKSLDILNAIGVKFEWEPALRVLQEAGCTVDFIKQLVKFPPDTVEDALKKCPNSFMIKARNPGNTLEFKKNKVYFSTQASPSIMDFNTGEIRYGTLKDIQEITMLQDALENIHAVFWSIEVLSDKPHEVHLEWITAEQIRNTTKCLMGSGFLFASKWLIELAQAVDIQLFTSATCSPPLTYPADQSDGIMQFAASGFPVFTCPGDTCGATSPATLAGTLLQQTVENLAGMALAQVVKPGVGYAMGTQSVPMDMRSGQQAIGIEQYMLGAATAQIARFYGVPSYTYNSFTGAKMPGDQQAGYEKGISFLILAQSGVSYIVGAGGIDDESCYSLEQLVIDNEIFGMISRYLNGIEVSEETLAADVIKKVGPIPGNFLREKHTLDWWRKEQFLPELSYRLPRQRWILDGSRDVAYRAREKAMKILQSHKPEPLPKEVDLEISRILRAAEKEKAGLH